MNEYREVPLALESTGKIDHLQLKSLISGIAAFVTKAVLVYPTKKLMLCRDHKDNMVLECCIAAKVDFLITGDKDLLDMEPLPFALRILAPRAFLRA
ncbi:MAG: putative toxin-antitoxin system toxin component, PIN family [Alphaproteobacteria bacterium]|uniref:Toxin-antitoxin system toxin component, PIN family n=1 Tax=Candidatus Nitrobium versatile TaxID=2884831 RepID=A0A953JBV3_9BACT|nr:putative toxin-antitoxin system toxin component, PIN family [Candidatus Nitrobium versatile]